MEGVVLNAFEERVLSFLEINQDELLENWMKSVMIDPNDPFKDSVKLNGNAMFNLVKSFLRNCIDEKQLQHLAYMVSRERLNANVNIGEFVYNVNIGRSEIFYHLPKMGLSIEELHPIIDKINVCFDKFLYFAVEHYTESKNKLLEEQSSFIEQTHKDHLTILGQMSSSFVHEFRNPLTSVIGFVQLLQEKYPSLEYLDVLRKELNQLKFRINQFLLVSKKGVKEKEREIFQISALLEETLDFLYPITLNSDVNIESDIDNSLYLYGYRDEFRQVLINIIMNSLDALTGYTIKIIRINGSIGDHNSVIMSISNNGPAISKDSIVSIFEPFVSTKKLGTGIGLYVCRKIIEEHNGTIYCESNEDWTTFHMEIPLKCTDVKCEET